MANDGNAHGRMSWIYADLSDPNQKKELTLWALAWQDAIGQAS